ncbi:MAG: EAL domain-containing protein, partial [Ruminiclostridium sp.]|nr:EAL domain-containing protein [Ruminiclostridium sp.]
MIENKKLIGVCLTRVEDDFRTEFLKFFHKIAEENNSKIIVFNSPRDFYYGDKYDEGAKSVYKFINYDALDALVILRESFYDEELVNGIIRSATDKGKPVVLVHGRHDDCYCIETDYVDAYRAMLDHLFGIHDIKDPVFIGGKPENDEQTVIRLGIYKEQLEKHGLVYTDDMLYYGDYWDVPAKKAVREIIRKRDRIPDAFVCANDTMAMAVCEELKAHGMIVPENVKVTGFDGLVSAEYYLPRLTTCREDIGALTKLTFDIIEDAIAGNVEKGVFIEKFVPFIGESCGCQSEAVIDYRERAREVFLFNLETRQHETHIYTWVDSVLDSDSLNTLSIALRDYILPNSSVCLNEGFIMTALGQSAEKVRESAYGEFIVISSKTTEYSGGKQGRFPLSEMIPDLNVWLGDSTMCVVSPITVGEESCGTYVVMIDDITYTSHKLFRVCKTMNIAFGALLNRLNNRNMQTSMISARFTDQLTGLPNHKGLTNWFNEFAGKEKNHNRTVMVSVYNIPQYRFIYENYGMDDIEEAVRFIADALRLANKDNGYIARTGNDEFVVFNYAADDKEAGSVINNAVSVFYGIIEGYNKSSSKDYYIEVNCGCTVASAGWNSDLSTFIKLANAEVYMNRLKAGISPVLKDEKIHPAAAPKDNKDLYNEFTVLIEKNLFTYFFQPIIDARTGDIVAYEALMRTCGGIQMSPLQILEIAKEYNKLYDIEKATMFNVMDRYVRDMEKFAGAKVFINTIPGNFLKQDDISVLREKYGQYISNFVFEITEQDTVSDDKLSSIRSLGVIGNTDEFRGIAGGQIAVDDYGTGHSNIVNLLRYAPHIIKIDRFLISNIQNDLNKQMFVKSTIEFAKMNNIKVLAEGVETFEEMKTVIEYGVDLIQGYYTSRPAEEPVGQIPDAVRNEVIAENISLTRMDNEHLVYRAKDGDVVNLVELAVGKYSRIDVIGGTVRVIGTESQLFEIEIRIEENVNTCVIFENVRIKAIDGPAIRIGRGSNVELRLKGSNFIQKNGIYVPSGSSFRTTGDGDLLLDIKRNGSVGIGSLIDETFGIISFEHTGSISVEIQLDRGICIGGGISDNASITFVSGKVSVLAQCVNSIGIGCVKGKADITVMHDALVVSKCSGRCSVAIGASDGELRITSTGTIDAVSDGEVCAAVGTTGSGDAHIFIEDGDVKAVVHSSKAVCLGTIEGTADVNVIDGHVFAYGEGDMVCGYGSTQGTGTTRVSGGTAAVKILSGCILQFGSDHCAAIFTGGNIIADKEELVAAINETGEPLHPERPGGDSVEREIST